VPEETVTRHTSCSKSSRHCPFIYSFISVDKCANDAEHHLRADALQPGTAAKVSSFFFLFASLTLTRERDLVFFLLSELRAHVASYTAYRDNDSVENLTAIAQRVRISLPPTAREHSQLVQAIPDAFHQGIPESQRGHYYHNSTFVDDNGIADIRDRIHGAIDNSTRAAYAIFGHPNDDRRAPCLSEEKMVELASYMMQYLGFLIHTRKMIMAWPVDKRQRLAQLIDDILATASRKITPTQSSSLLGLVRNGAVVAPLAVYLSLCLQHQLNDATHAAWRSMSRCSHWVWDEPNRSWIRHWYRNYHIQLDVATVQDLRLLRSKISLAPEHPIWYRPIAMLVRREPTSQCYSDACGYAGLGGWTDSSVFRHSSISTFWN
jgi:hypothetical protein